MIVILIEPACNFFFATFYDSTDPKRYMKFISLLLQNNNIDSIMKELKEFQDSTVTLKEEKESMENALKEAESKLDDYKDLEDKYSDHKDLKEKYSELQTDFIELQREVG